MDDEELACRSAWTEAFKSEKKSKAIVSPASKAALNNVAGESRQKVEVAAYHTGSHCEVVVPDG